MNHDGYRANEWVRHLGVYEPGKPIEEVARELGFESIDDIAKLASNENELGPSPRAVAAMIAAAPRMHRYPDGGAFYLRRAVGERLGVSPDMLVMGSGSNELIDLLGHVFLSKGTSIVMADRAFVVYRLIAAAYEAETVAVPMRDYTHDLQAMAEAVTPSTRIVFVANPNNPTGTMVGQAEIDAFMRRVPAHVLVVFDEAYVELLEPRDQPDVMKYVREGRRVMVLRTFSKTYGLAGLRIGYAVGPKACVDLVHRVRQPFNVNAMALEAAQAALEDDEHVARTRRMVADGMRQLTVAFEAMGLEYVPSVANFVLVKVGRGREVFQALQARKVIARPMDGYGLPDHIRITVGREADNAQCLEALRAVLGR